MTPTPAARRVANDEQRDTLAGLEEAVRLAQRLSPDWRDPERFHLAKSELVNLLRTIAASPVLVRATVRFVRTEVPVEKIILVPASPRPRARRRHRYPLPPAGPGGLF
ncbi:MAG: hypothetical protein ACJ8AI_10610 [Rhodopila sp.]